MQELDGQGPSFVNYLHRRVGATFVGFPTRWRIDAPPLESPAPIAVVLHVYYADLVDEILHELRAIEVPFDLIVTNASGVELDLSAADSTAAQSVRSLDVENRGRDILPTLQVINAGLLDPYDLVFKIHTKRSEWRESHDSLQGSGDQWKLAFYDELLGSPENVRDIIQSMRENPHVGAVTAAGSVTGPEHWGGNRDTVRELLKRFWLRNRLEDLEFAAGSIYWIRGFVLQGLRALLLESADFEDEAGQIDGTTAHAVERIIGILTEEAGMHTVERGQLRADTPATASELETSLRSPAMRARAIAYYLPQFHPFWQNDDWWGRGFTEWDNVAKAAPLYAGHNQPLRPGELGFYDLRLDVVRERQTELAKGAGLSAFMYYYYWFSGTKLMETPIERLLESDLDQPICIMWANENWTRRWDGDEASILIAQEYDGTPPEQFIDDVMPLLKDDRYVRIDGAALLAVYRIAHIPDYESVLEHWRRRAREEGVGELFIAGVDVGTTFAGLQSDYEDAGVQGFIAFPPHNHHWVGRHGGEMAVTLRSERPLLDYASMASAAEDAYLEGIRANQYPGAMVTFDNTARRQWTPDAWVGSNPYTFRRWLSAAVSAVADREPEHRIVFVNAWNEWAESAVLEPTERWGSTYMHAVRSAVQ
ncbi:MAG: glycoside hydrolase family 99-like domain-containing protein [Pseudoclavibacter sp.]